MSEHPILFSGPLVRAILAGQKTVTRRPVKWPVLGPGVGRKRRHYTAEDVAEINAGAVSLSPFGRAGDHLWVRETWWECSCGCDQIIYREKFDAGGYPSLPVAPSRWRPSIHMPRRASRITLRVTDIRIEQLHAIDEADALREGVDAVSIADVPRNGTLSRVADFAQLWAKLYGRDSWDANLWVWRGAFEVIDTQKGGA